MSVARVTEISARSEESFEAAITEGIDRANSGYRSEPAPNLLTRPSYSD